MAYHYPGKLLLYLLHRTHQQTPSLLLTSFASCLLLASSRWGSIELYNKILVKKKSKWVKNITDERREGWENCGDWKPAPCNLVPGMSRGELSVPKPFYSLRFFCLLIAVASIMVITHGMRIEDEEG